MLNRRIAFAALLACLVALVAVPAAGADKPHPTSIFVSEKFPAFHGSLKSADDSCIGGRQVSLFRTQGGKTQKLGSDRSDAQGKWQIRVGNNLTSGEYIATVAKRGDCQGVRSKPVVVD